MTSQCANMAKFQLEQEAQEAAQSSGKAGCIYKGTSSVSDGSQLSQFMTDQDRFHKTYLLL